MDNQQRIIASLHDYEDFLLADFCAKRLQEHKQTIAITLEVYATVEEAKQFVADNYSAYRVYPRGSYGMYVFMPDALIGMNDNSNSILAIRIYSEPSRVHAIKEELLQHFQEATVYMRWCYGDTGEQTDVRLDVSNLPCTEMFPFLDGESLESYYMRFQQDRSSVLVLIGPPGTGKTSFIRGYLAATNSSAIVTYNENILSRDTIFAGFISGTTSTMIIEDADMFLTARSDGNGLMHKFLNVGDGLITTKGKKLIFSTNLPNVTNIDEALLRDGRCFDVLQFAPLNRVQALALAKAKNLEYDASESQTIANIFAGKKRNTKSKFGFTE